METFSALLALCAGNSPVTGEFPTQRASDAEIKCWVNNREAGDLRRLRANQYVTVMSLNAWKYSYRQPEHLIYVYVLFEK